MAQQLSLIIDNTSAPTNARGTRLRPDWQPSCTDIDFAHGEGFAPYEVRRLAESFRDYWCALGGSKGCKRDWHATWRNWCRRESDWRRQRMPRHGTRGLESAAAGLARFLDGEGGGR